MSSRDANAGLKNTLPEAVSQHCAFPLRLLNQSPGLGDSHTGSGGHWRRASAKDLSKPESYLTPMLPELCRWKSHLPLPPLSALRLTPVASFQIGDAFSRGNLCKFVLSLRLPSSPVHLSPLPGLLPQHFQGPARQLTARPTSAASRGAAAHYLVPKDRNGAGGGDLLGAKPDRGDV